MVAKLAEWDLSHLADDAALVVSELLTNGLRESGDVVIMTLAREAKGAVVRVWDSSPEMPVMKELDFLTEKGRGLHIIAALSSEHGCDRADSGGKVSWARLTIGSRPFRSPATETGYRIDDPSPHSHRHVNERHIE
jgi:histidine kinase-like protein